MNVGAITTSPLQATTVDSPRPQRDIDQSSNRGNTNNDDAAYVRISGTPPQDEQPSFSPSKASNEETPQRAVAASEDAPSEEDKQEEKEKKAEQAEIKKLQARDREVRAHEQAHLSALGPYKSGGASFSYQTGPDGRRYAVGGEVSVDVSPEKTPEETVRKMQVIQRAALAPAEPSGADRAVAAQAAQIEAQARAEIAKEATKGEDGEKSKGEVEVKSDETKEGKAKSLNSSCSHGKGRSCGYCCYESVQSPQRETPRLATA